jgi:hypothetical protein
VRNFDWLPFTPPLVAFSGPSYMIGAIVAVVHGEPLELPCDVVGGPGVQVPIGIIASRGGSHGRHMIVRNILFIIAIPADTRHMAQL